MLTDFEAYIKFMIYKIQFTKKQNTLFLLNILILDVSFFKNN